MNMAVCHAGGATLITEMERVVTSVASSLALPWEGVTGMGKSSSQWEGLLGELSAEWQPTLKKGPPSVPGEKLTGAWGLCASLSVG